MTMEVATTPKYAISLLPAESVSSITRGLKVRVETQLDEVILTVEKSDYRALCERLFAANFDFPSSMTGVDMEWGLGVVLHVQQLESKRKVAVRTYLPYDAPTLPTVSDMWGGVDWHEREAYDHRCRWQQIQHGEARNLGRASICCSQGDRKSTRLNSSHVSQSRMPSSA